MRKSRWILCLWMRFGADVASAQTAEGNADKDGTVGLRVEDVNGDGYPDIVGRIPAPVRQPEDDARSYIYLNNQSNGFVEIEEWIVPKPLTQRMTNLSHILEKSDLLDAGIRLLDVNGDGLADVLQSLYVNTATAVGAITPTYLAKGGIGDLLIEYTNALGERPRWVTGA